MTDAIERAARAMWRELYPYGDAWSKMDDAPKLSFRIQAETALASLRPGDKITLADGKECWIAPMEATQRMLIEADRATDLVDATQAMNRAEDRLREFALAYIAMRDACMRPKALKCEDDLSDYHEPDDSGYSRADEEWFFDAEGKP